jgi:hypothetical protein
VLLQQQVLLLHIEALLLQLLLRRRCGSELTDNNTG